MESYLYQDLYTLEDEHWWHRAKRSWVSEALTWCQQVRGQVFTPKHDSLLDVGCGTGKNLEFFSKQLTTYGLDMSAEALAFCKKRGLKNLKLGNGKTLPYTDNFYTVATALDVLEHTDDQELLAELFRVIKPGGYLIATVPAFQFLWSQWDVVLHHKRRYTSSSLTKVVAAAGFSPLKCSYLYSFLVVPVYVIRTIKQLLNSKQYQSDFALSHPLINTVMAVVTKFERTVWWRTGLPFGTSVVIIAKKPDQTTLHES